MNMAQRIQPQAEQHDYDRGSGLFAKAVGHEKLAILLPELRKSFNAVVASGEFIPEKDKMLDYGCGPFSLSIPFVRDLVHVDGVDTSGEMLKTAKQNIASWRPKFSEEAAKLMSSVKLTSSINQLKNEDYGIVMMNFVHQCASDYKTLKRYFRDCADKMKPGAHMFITGAWAENLHKPHACYEYDITDSRALKDGDIYTGRIFDETGDSVYELQGDYFWSNNALSNAANDGGDLRLVTVTEIADKETGARKGDSPAYFLMHLKK